MVPAFKVNNTANATCQEKVADVANETCERAVVALSHTPNEHQLYEAMSAKVFGEGTRIGAFSVRNLMLLTGLNSYSTVRRALLGLKSKLSIEHYKVAGDQFRQCSSYVYYIFPPEEILSRRRAASMATYPKEIDRSDGSIAFGSAIERIIRCSDLSRREAQVALCCIEGLTNAEISDRLCISEDTTKTHLQHVFAKFGVRRRTELISRLLGII